MYNGRKKSLKERILESMPTLFFLSIIDAIVLLVVFMAIILPIMGLDMNGGRTW